MLIARVRTALIALVLFLGALFYLPRLAWALFLMPWLLMGAWEWGALAQWTRTTRVCYLLLITALCTALWQLAIVPAHAVVTMAVFAIALLFWLTAVPLWLARGWRIQQPLVLAAAGIIVLLPMWLAMVQLQHEPSVLLVPAQTGKLDQPRKDVGRGGGRARRRDDVLCGCQPGLSDGTCDAERAVRADGVFGIDCARRGGGFV
jgi:phosphatidate cytidylyltransferase